MGSNNASRFASFVYRLFSLLTFPGAALFDVVVVFVVFFELRSGTGDVTASDAFEFDESQRTSLKMMVKQKMTLRVMT